MVKNLFGMDKQAFITNIKIQIECLDFYVSLFVLIL